MRTILWCAALLAVACGGDPAHGNSSAAAPAAASAPAAPPAATAAVGMPTLTYFTMRG